MDAQNRLPAIQQSPASSQAHFNVNSVYQAPSERGSKQVTIRLANESDIDGIAEAHTKSWHIYFDSGLFPEFLRQYFDKQAFKKEREHDIAQMRAKPNEYFTYVAEIDGKIVGFCNGGHMKESFYNNVRRSLEAQTPEGGDPRQITGCSDEIYIHPDYQGLEIGTMLMLEKGKRLKQMGFSNVCTYAVGGHTSPNFFAKFDAYQIGSFTQDLYDVVRETKGIELEKQDGKGFDVRFDIYMYRSVQTLIDRAQKRLLDKKFVPA